MPAAKLRPGKRSESVVGHFEPADRSRDRHSALRILRILLAVNGGCRSRRGALAVVDHGGLTAARARVDDHESPAGDVPGNGVGRLQSKRRGDGRIDRIAPAFQDIPTDIRAGGGDGNDDTVMAFHVMVGVFTSRKRE